MAREKLAIVGGHSILGAEPGEGYARRTVEVDGAPVELHEHEGNGTLLLQRHGLSRYRTAAKIDHGHNLRALAELGCSQILAISSVGGLRRDLGVGTFLCPDDFIALHLGLSLSDQHGGERVPGFDESWRESVLAAWGRAAEPDLIDGGVYWQAIGPRFETPAEIRFIAAHAEVIGMTMASECILAGELGIPYASICVVDNLANGISEMPLSVEEFETGKAANRVRLVQAVDAVAEELAGRNGAG